MEIKKMQKSLENFSKEDLHTFKRFLEIIIRQYLFDEKAEKAFFNLDIRTINEAALPLTTVREFANLLSKNISNFINIRSLHKEEYQDFQKYRELREIELYDIGEEQGYTKDEIRKEITNEFDGIFIKSLNSNLIKSISKLIEISDEIISVRDSQKKDDCRIKIYIKNYLIYRILNGEKLETEIKSPARKLLLTYLLDNDRQILRKELSKYILENLGTRSNRSDQDVSADVKDINKHFREQLKFTKQISNKGKYRLILPSNKKGYSINHKTFNIERLN